MTADNVHSYDKPNISCRSRPQMLKNSAARPLKPDGRNEFPNMP